MSVYAADEVFKLLKVNYKIIVDGREVTSDLPILNYNGNTYVPLSRFSKFSSADIKWDKTNQKVIIVNKDTSIIPSVTPVPSMSYTLPPIQSPIPVSPKKCAVVCNEKEVTKYNFKVYEKNGVVMLSPVVIFDPIHTEKVYGLNENPTTEEFTLFYKDDNSIRYILKVGNSTFYLNNISNHPVEMKMDFPVEKVDNEVYIPIETFLKCTIFGNIHVSYDEIKDTVNIKIIPHVQ